MCVHTKPVWVNQSATSQNIFPALPKDFSPREEKLPGTFSETDKSRFVETSTSMLMKIIVRVPNNHPAL